MITLKRSHKERSPRTRGRQKPCRAFSAAQGTIPAHAGKTLHFLQSPIAPWNHPSKQRETKETNNYSVRYDERSLLSQGKGTDELVESQFEEQSPLTRGRLKLLVLVEVLERNIPARAGKTDFMPFSAQRNQKDPRVCEEDSKEWTVPKPQ